jgi:hypothetical protein
MNGLRTAPNWTPNALATRTQTTDRSEPGMSDSVSSNRPLTSSGSPLALASTRAVCARQSPAVTT